jgi:competence protein ComEA
MLKKILAILVMLYATLAMAAVDVNKATDAQLDSVKGIGPVTSRTIMAERKKGDFKSWQDFIDRVKGVGEKSAVKLSENGLTVNGEGFKGAAAAPAAKKEEKKAEAKPAAAAVAAAPVTKEEKKDAKAEAKAKKEAEKKAKAEEKARKAEEAKAKKDAKTAKASAAKPAASAASAAKK